MGMGFPETALQGLMTPGVRGKARGVVAHPATRRCRASRSTILSVEILHMIDFGWTYTSASAAAASPQP